MAEAVSDYSALDRLLHRLAFASPAVQLAAADFEQLAFRSAYCDANAQKPIFITSLPRAGTTIILAALHRLPTLATHTYRDMPFVMAPILWSRLSSAFRKQSPLRERAHGDGLQISADSPEAFEEIIWRAFWPEKYSKNGIELWASGDTQVQAQEFLRDHFRKIVALRCGDRLAEGRYISKNNANIARIDWISAMMPGAKILVPVRRPMDHAASLLLQHRNFLAIHARDKFASRYMSDIGHYEFGALHRPILFPGFSATGNGHDPGSIDYWLAYWIAAFEHILSRRNQVIAVSYDGICERGVAGVSDLCSRLGIDPDGRLEELAAVFRPAVSHEAVTTSAKPALRKRAEELYASLSRLWTPGSQ